LSTGFLLRTHLFELGNRHDLRSESFASKWEGIFKDPMTTAAAIDRLVHHSIIVELNISSYWLEQAKGSAQSLGRDAGEPPTAAPGESALRLRASPCAHGRITGIIAVFELKSVSPLS
jgi:hypothetical protein